MENRFSLEEIEQAAEHYCSDCCKSCSECGLYDFINFELTTCLGEVVRNEKNYSAW